VIFINQLDIDMLGMKAGDWVDVEACGMAWSAAPAGFMLVAYDIPRGCIGAYPETNPLVPLEVWPTARARRPRSRLVLLTPADAS
jgi:anaerobic selenocysteine-containing dehydrogenase